MSYRLIPACIVALGFVSYPAFAQQGATAPCKLTQPNFTTKTPNIFNDQQEQDLGDALAEYFESDMHVAVPAADDQLTRIGEKLLATLPPTGIKFRFRIYDSGEVNGFSLPGGRVYISRKLIVAVKNEDELAAVLAHEIGHIVTHQSAIEMTRVLRIRLGVTQVGDRADVFAKVHKMFSTPEKSNEGEDSEEKDQLIADSVGLYALVQAGYASESMASLLNDTMSNKGKTGNWVSDMFGLTHEASQRYRRALKLAAALPQDCKGRKMTNGDAFANWRKENVEDRVKFVAAGATGDREQKLDPPLRQSPWRIRFSPDGRYVLSQDGGSITVVDRTKTKMLFMIDAPNANQAQFTPDSSGVVFHDDNLRVERWDIATGKRVSVKELVVYDGCDQTVLTPDGKTMACLKISFEDSSIRFGLKLIDVDSGSPFFDKPKYQEFSYMQISLSGLINLGTRMEEHTIIVPMVVSPSGRYLLIGDETRMNAWDLQSRQQMTLGGKLHGMQQAQMTFVGNDQLFVIGDWKNDTLRHGRLYSFPAGNLIKDVDIGNVEVEGATRGNYLIVSSLKDYVSAVFDIDKGSFVAASKISPIDYYDKLRTSEATQGGVEIAQEGSSELITIPLPLSPLAGIRAATISDDGKFIAFSVKNRAGIWNAESGKQLTLIRPFQSAWLDDKDRMWALFTKYGDKDAQEAALTLSPLGEKAYGKFEKQDFQYQNLQLTLKPLGKEKDEFTRHARLEVKNIDGQTVAWSREFQKETPAFWPAEDDRLVLGWDLSNDSAKSEIKSYPQLQKEAEAFKDKKKGLLLETVVPETGKPLEQVIIPETDLGGGWRDVRRAMVSGDYVLVRGEHSNTVIYHLDGSGKVGEFFGSPVATDAKLGLIAGVNRDNEVMLVDERTGKELKRFTLNSPVRLANFVGDKEKTLLLLTADQVVHRIPVTSYLTAQADIAH